MSDDLVELLTSPQFVLAILVSVSVFATLFTLLTPLLGGNELKTRMKAVATERDEIRARERARLAAEKQQSRGSLRMEAKEGGVRRIVERLDLKTALADQATIDKLRAAGYRGQQPLNVFRSTSSSSRASSCRWSFSRSRSSTSSCSARSPNSRP